MYTTPTAINMAKHILNKDGANTSHHDQLITFPNFNPMKRIVKAPGKVSPVTFDAPPLDILRSFQRELNDANLASHQIVSSD